jgi:hypothetical protein
MSPHWIELNDFKTYAALQSALHTCTNVVVACLNARLMQLHHGSSSWDFALRSTLHLLDSVNVQIRSFATPEQPAALGLAYVERSRQFALLVGTGNPDEWELPPSATLLRPQSAWRTTAHLLPDAHAKPWLLETPLWLVLGTVEPVALPHCAAYVLLLLLLLEIILNIAMYGMICSFEDQIGSCAAVGLVLPFAGHSYSECNVGQVTLPR